MADTADRAGPAAAAARRMVARLGRQLVPAEQRDGSPAADASVIDRQRHRRRRVRVRTHWLPVRVDSVHLLHRLDPRSPRRRVRSRRTVSGPQAADNQREGLGDSGTGPRRTQHHHGHHRCRAARQRRGRPERRPGHEVRRPVSGRVRNQQHALASSTARGGRPTQATSRTRRV